LPIFRLAHLSDPHLPPVSGAWRELAPKGLVSRIAWRRKRRRHLPAVLSAIVADIKSQAPDHIAVTGDLTNFSARAEFAAARAWLEALSSPRSLTVSPGNHDALTGSAGAERFAPWLPWLGDDESPEFPMVRRRGPVAIVNLCSAVPTALHLAQGELGEPQVRRLAQHLQVLEEQGLFRVLLIHHPVAPGTVSPRKALRDAPALLDVLRTAGAELVLHGHGHKAAVAAVPGPNGRIPVLGVPSASAVGEHGDDRARWHAIEIETGAAAAATRVVARELASDGQVREIGRYALAELTDSAA
jgi:3',5'-cyclic AMP phosphodiesterase CpdA